MALNTLTFSAVVEDITAYAQSASAALLDFSTGSVLLSLSQAYASVVVWLESLIIYVLTLTRASTSSGSDVDSWMADFGLTRLAATQATGQVTFSRLSGVGQAVVPVGATVQSSDGTQTFTVTIDTTNAAYVAGIGYVMGNTVSSVNAPVIATNSGTGGNVLANSITVITSSISGVDTVNNAAAFTNAINAESDTAFRARFILYIQSLSKATKLAIGAAITGVQQGLSYTLTENQDYNGTTDYGYFYVVLDDGTGYPSSTLLASVGSAIDAVRGCGLRFGVFAPVVITANVGMVLTTASGYTHSTVIAAVSVALQAAINSAVLGQSLPYTQLASIAYSVPGVTNVTSVTLNGGTSDLTLTNQQVLLCGTLTIS